MAIGIGIGKSTHTVVWGFDPETKVFSSQEFVPNSWDGVQKVKIKVDELSKVFGGMDVVFVGNHRWGTPFAAALADGDGLNLLYFKMAAERGQRGRAGDVVKSLAMVFASGIRPRPYFGEKSKGQPQSGGGEAEATTYRLATEYLEASNRVRGLKHHILDCLAILFPEVVKSGKTSKKIAGQDVSLPVPQPQPPELFSRKMETVLNRAWDFQFLEESLDVPEDVKTLARRSLGQFLPQDLRLKTSRDFDDFLRMFRAETERKAEKIEELRQTVVGHPLLQKYGDGDVITVLAGFLGWRQWPNWRELRRFCGLDVTRLDSRGKMRISRVRPQIRMYLYLFATLTKAGKEITAGKKKRVKKLERLLKTFWLEVLRYPAEQICVPSAEK